MLFSPRLNMRKQRKEVGELRLPLIPMKKTTLAMVLFLLPSMVSAETLEGKIIDVQALIRNKQVSIPYQKCGLVEKVVPITTGANKIYNSDDILQRLFKTVTAPTAKFYVEECHTEHRDETQSVLEGYLVTYVLNNVIYQTRTKVRPESNTIKIKVSHEIQ